MRESLHGVRSVSENPQPMALSVVDYPIMQWDGKKAGGDSNNTWSSCSPVRSNHVRKPINAVTCSSGLFRKEERVLIPGAIYR